MNDNEFSMKTTCCAYEIQGGEIGPVHANPFNGVVQCHNCGQVYAAAAPVAAQPVAVFDGYIDGGAAVIQWRGKALPAGTLLYDAAQLPQAATVEDCKEATQDTFCDAFCTWRDHHPECKRGDAE